MARTHKQERASRRNWLKARLLSWVVNDHSLLTDEEIKIVAEIDKLRMKLLDNWNANSIKFKEEKNNG